MFWQPIYAGIFKELRLEIGFIEEMRITTWGNEELCQTFFPNSSYSRKYKLVNSHEFCKNFFLVNRNAMFDEKDNRILL